MLGVQAISKAPNMQTLDGDLATLHQQTEIEEVEVHVVLDEKRATNSPSSPEGTG